MDTFFVFALGMVAGTFSCVVGLWVQSYKNKLKIRRINIICHQPTTKDD